MKSEGQLPSTVRTLLAQRLDVCDCLYCMFVD
jgi:hypothetical protein